MSFYIKRRDLAFKVTFHTLSAFCPVFVGEKTDGYMGASEMLMATALSGVIFSLFGGQPLLITGFTGPNMVFEEGVYRVRVV